MARSDAHAVFLSLRNTVIDVSGMDLSRLDLPDLKALTGVVWSQETIWPPGMDKQIRDRGAKGTRTPDPLRAKQSRRDRHQRRAAR